MKPYFLFDARDGVGISQVDDFEKVYNKSKTFTGYGTLETSNRDRGVDIDQYQKLLTKAPYTTTPRPNGSDNSKRKKM